MVNVTNWLREVEMDLIDEGDEAGQEISDCLCACTRGNTVI